ncbi:DEAD-domain-containing protein [Meira miltonrushii]|uniref:ATP-dependent RNA helicase n=1 Tax=Meira miltonrushii TaxID=1280837 RepID=A0A316V8M2_9BASI|nr:DEAD-domain-containing protein [Meira miltonrushii]PWN33564.1 DEAD-domain-containing protein [Meira miltonrushii]
MTYTLTARSLCSRSLATATIASQSSSLLIQSDLSRLLPIQASARTFSTTPTCLRNPSNKVRLPKRIISDPSEVDESHLDKPTDKEGKAANPITNEYSTLKPYMNYDTWKALTGKPFNFKEMSEVQERVLSLLPDLADPFNDTPMPDNQGGRDLLVKAKTGTGKTVAFLVPAIERRLRAARQVLKGNYTGPFAKMLAKEKPELYEATDLDKQTKVSIWRNFHANTAGVLVLSPTRELATQIATEAEKLTMHQKNFGVQLLVGGASRSIQVRTWSRTRPDIVVATPGRLLDLLNEEPMVSKALSAVQTLIYDEADTLLDMGFRDDLEKILQFLPKKEDRSTMLFSATVSSDIREIARKSLGSDHRFIDCVPAGESNVHEHIPQFATVVRDGKEQLEQLTRLIAIDQLRNPGKSKIVVFAPTTKMVQLYADLFNFSQGLVNSLPAGRNTASYELHSRKDSSQRFRISSSFRNDKRGASILFTSDVSARGVDYPGTTRVINLGISGTTDQYIHRIGRTGRAGAQGRADIILQGFEAGFLEASLNKLPIKVETVDETKAQLAKLCEDFDRDPESIVDPEIWKIMNDPTLRPRWSKEGSNSTQYIARFISPMSERLSDDILKAKAESAKSSADPAEVEGVFMSNLGFYIPKAYAMDTTANNVIEGLKEWAMSLAELPREPYVSPATLAKMGVSTGNRRTSDRFGRSSSRFGGSMSGSGRFDRGDSGRDRSDRGYSGRDRFDRGGSGRDRFDRGDGRRGRSPGKYNFDGHSREGPSYGRRSSERFF